MNQYAAGNQPPYDGTTKQAKSGWTLAGNLIGALLLAIGVANYWGDNGKLVDYHNQFVKNSFNEVFFDKWNKLIALQVKEGTTDQEIHAYLKDTLIPVVKTWQKKISEVDPPEFAKPYHVKFQARLGQFDKDLKVLVAAIDGKDGTRYKDTFTKIVGDLKIIEKDLHDFEDLLVSEKGIKMEG